MSRDHTRRSEATTASFTSFGNSSVSDFDPEREALASTRQMDNIHRLPQMNGRASRKHREPIQDEQDYTIDTSSLERAFPDFSQLHSSEEDDEISIEVGRGPSKPARRLDDSRNSIMSFENSVRSSSPAIRLDYPTSHTPKSAIRSAPRRAVSESLRKDAQLRRAGLAQKEAALDAQISKNRKDQRRTLSEMHAKVRDNYDGSFVGDERPAAVAATARPTRFGNANISGQIADAVERASQEAYAKEARRGKTPATTRNAPANGTHTTNTVGDTATHHSFLLPDLPNLSELVSGVYEDGTPVFSSQNKARTTRFTSPPNDAADVSLTREHMPLDAIPIPEDEKALFVSLRLLQDKVAELELAKSEAEKKVEEIRQENASLKAERGRQKDKYGRVRSYDMEEDGYRRDGARLSSENKKLEAANLALQNQLDIADRKAQVHESALKRFSRERDMAVSQLGVAYLESQDLKTENENLRQENEELKTQLARFASSTRKTREDDTAQASTGGEADAEDTKRSADLSRNKKDLTSRSTRSQAKPKFREDTRTRISSQVDREIARLEKERAEEALFTLDLPNPRRASAPASEKTDTRPKINTVDAKKQPNTGKQRVKRVIVEEVDETTADIAEPTRRSSGADQDDTLLSFMDAGEIAKLRKTLEEERLARKQQQYTEAKDQTANETLNNTRQSGPSKPIAPRKSSLKETKVTIARPASVAGDLTATSKASMNEGDSNLSVPLPRQRRHSENSVHTISQRRRRRNAEEMTSAFILPDITIRHADLAVENPAKLPESTQRVLDSVSGHNGKNCTICKHVVPGDTCDHTRDTVKIPKPVPVSERMPEPSVYNEEPTMRPSQPPAIALATVLKALEDELAHLRMKLATHQAAYNKLDASLSRRQRKTLHEKIERILKDIDMKADQIYALYDVVEGQKQDINQMTEREMEVTLQSIGINVPKMRVADVTATTDRSSHKNVEAESDEDDDDEELPWEGFESTAEVTGGSRRD